MSNAPGSVDTVLAEITQQSQNETQSEVNTTQETNINEEQVTEQHETVENTVQDPSSKLDKNHPRYQAVMNKLDNSSAKLITVEAENNYLKNELSEVKNLVSNLNNNFTQQTKDARISQLEKEYVEATQDGDIERQTKINFEYQKLMAENIANQNKTKEPETPKYTSNMQAEASLAVFRANNPWYGSDPALTGAFDYTVQQIINDPLSRTKPASTILDNALSNIKADFPSKFSKAKPKSAVAGTTVAPSTGVQKQGDSHGLTPAQKAAAETMFGLLGFDKERCYKEYKKGLEGK